MEVSRLRSAKKLMCLSAKDICFDSWRYMLKSTGFFKIFLFILE